MPRKTVLIKQTTRHRCRVVKYLTYICMRFYGNMSTVGGYKTFRFGQSVELSHVEQLQVGLDASLDYGLVAHLEIKVYYAELVGKAAHQREQAWRENVYA